MQRITRLLPVVFTMLLSCAAAPEPDAGKEIPAINEIPEDVLRRTGTPPPDLRGIWKASADTGTEEGSTEIFFLSDGTVVFRALWPDGNNHALMGSYVYDPARGSLFIEVYDPLARIRAEVSGDPPSFEAMEDVFYQTQRFIPPHATPLESDLIGLWELPYNSIGEKSRVLIRIHEGGAFTETTRYGNGDDLISETGEWRWSSSDGLVRFTYDKVAQEDFAVLLLPDESRLITPAGEFRRLEGS